jgi:hypothetical protein
MATTVNNVNNELKKFKKNIAYSFLRAGRFDPYTSDSINAVIRRVRDLEANGKQINVPLVDQLRGDGVATGVLSGNEEGVDNYGIPLWPSWARHAVAFDRNTKKETSINIRDTATPLLGNWTKRIRRDDVIKAFHSFPTASEQASRLTGSGNRINGIRYSDATSTQRNNWLTANADRVLFGNATGNLVSGNYSSSLANCDTTNDKMSTAVASLAKRIAQRTTYPQINPWQIEGTDEEWYVMFMGSRAFRDLKADTAMLNANRDARPRESGNVEKDNPIFSGSSTLVYDGIIFKEIPEFDTQLLLTGVGASSADVAPCFLCGQSALAFVVGQMPRVTRKDETDYQFREGVGTEMQYGVGKIAKAPVDQAGAIGNLVDWGMCTIHVAASADT